MSKPADPATHQIALYSASGECLYRNQPDTVTSDSWRERFPDESAAELWLQALRSGYSSGVTQESTGTGRRTVLVQCHRLSGAGEAGILTIVDPVGSSDRSAAADIATIAHDFRAPLNAVQGFADFLRQMGDELPLQKRQAYLEDILTATRRMTALADKFVGIGNPAAEVDLGPVSLVAIAEEVVRRHRRTAKAKGVSLKWQGVDPALIADEEATLRIIENLTMNALTHGARKGGSVCVRIGVDDGSPMVEVADDGQGLDEVELAQAMQPYRRAKPGQAAGGLGLPNAQALASSMGARLEIDTAPGKGFCARLVFAV